MPPQFEVNLLTEEMQTIFEKTFSEWTVLKTTVVDLSLIHISGALFSPLPIWICHLFSSHLLRQQHHLIQNRKR